MQITDILAPDRTLCEVVASSKQAALAELARLLAKAEPSLTYAEVLQSLLRREKQGSTGFGKGWALPHGRLPQCPRTLGAFIRLSAAVDYEALDGQPVRLLFALLVPEQSTGEHLQILARLAETFSDEKTLRQLQSEPSSAKIYQILTS